MTSKVGKTRGGDEEEERVQTGIEEESDVREMYVYACGESVLCPRAGDL